MTRIPSGKKRRAKRRSPLGSSIPQAGEAVEASGRGTLCSKASAVRRDADTSGGIAMDAREGRLSSPRDPWPRAAPGAGAPRPVASSWERRLATTARKPGAAPGSPQFAASLARFTAAINRIAANSGVNGYELRNEILVEMEKDRVRYENGRALEGYSAERLFEDARRSSANHRRTLARNLNTDSGQARPANVCAHHVVASKDIRAEDSRDVIFEFGIAINDCDNGVYLPRFKNVKVPSMPKAPVHGPIHTARYHAAVAGRLILREPQDAAACRAILRKIKKDIVAGSFPWREE